MIYLLCHFFEARSLGGYGEGGEGLSELRDGSLLTLVLDHDGKKQEYRQTQKIRHNSKRF